MEAHSEIHFAEDIGKITCTHCHGDPSEQTPWQHIAVHCVAVDGMQSDTKTTGLLEITFGQHARLSLKALMVGIGGSEAFEFSPLSDHLTLDFAFRTSWPMGQRLNALCFLSVEMGVEELNPGT